MGIVPIAVMPIVAPKGEYKKSPYVLDESLPKVRDPRVVMNERMQKRALEQAKNKPDNERNFFDYLILAQEKMKEIDPRVY